MGDTRMKLLEVFINQVLEVNQRKAMQDEVPMSFKEVMEVAKDKIENVNDYFPTGMGNGSNPGSRVAGGGWKKEKEKKEKLDSSEGVKERMKRFVNGNKVNGKEYCLDYNIKGEDGKPGCQSRGCKLAHNCTYVPRGESKPCGGRHSKLNHFDLGRK